HVGAAFACEPAPSGKRGVTAVLYWSVRHVAADQRALSAAPDRFAADQHFLKRDVEHIGSAPEIDADRVADRNEIEAGAIGDAGNLIVPGNEADAFLPVPLHLLQVGNCDLVVHVKARRKGPRSSTKSGQRQSRRFHNLSGRDYDSIYGHVRKAVPVTEFPIA